MAEKQDIVDVPHASTLPFDSCSKPEPSLLWSLTSPSQHVPLSSDHLFPTVYSDPSLSTCSYDTVPFDYTSLQTIRKPSAMLNTTRQSPLPSSIGSRVFWELECLSMDMKKALSDNGCIGLATSVARQPSGMRPIPDWVLSPLDSVGYHPANLGDRTGDALALPSPSGSTANLTNFETQSPVKIYQPPEKRGSGRRHSKRACAIKIGDLWIDKDDLNSGMGHGGHTIVVHECRWAAYTNPCGMWIIGSRPHIGAHIRAWHHGQKPAWSRAKCLWDGCAQTMLHDSVNRHVVSVHLQETFHCQGCRQEFPRKDVYNQHIDESEGCKKAGAMVMYGTETRAVDTHGALDQLSEVRYASRY